MINLNTKIFNVETQSWENPQNYIFYISKITFGFLGNKWIDVATPKFTSYYRKEGTTSYCKLQPTQAPPNLPNFLRITSTFKYSLSYFKFYCKSTFTFSTFDSLSDFLILFLIFLFKTLETHFFQYKFMFI